MNDFLFSLNSTVPIFFIILIGWFLRQKGMLNDGFLSAGNKFVFSVALPALLFRDISGADIRNVFDLKYVLYCMIVTSCMFWGIWLFTELFMKDRSMIGAFVQASFRGSQSGSLKNAAINILKNPIILGIFLGLPFSFLHIDFPDMIDKCINNLAVTATPLGLLLVGAGFEGRKALAKMKPTIAATAIKLFLLPALFLPVAMYLGFHGEAMIAILIMLGSPTTVSCYIMAKNMGNDDVLTSSIIVLATLLSSISLTFWVFLLRTTGFV